MKSDLYTHISQEQYNQARGQYIHEMEQIHDAMKDITIDAENPSEQQDSRQQQFTVTNPMKVQKHIKYTVRGIDSDGAFEEMRRFSEFFALRNMLSLRWPGVYIPQIPEKKVMGNKDDKFVEERRLLLERFLKECAKYDYIINSREFKIFSRDKGEIDRVLNMMPKQTPMQILEKYRQNFTLAEDVNPSKIQHYKDTIKGYLEFSKKVMVVMKTQKKELKAQMERYKA